MQSKYACLNLVGIIDIMVPPSHTVETRKEKGMYTEGYLTVPLGEKKVQLAKKPVNSI